MAEKICPVCKIDWNEEERSVEVGDGDKEIVEEELGHGRSRGEKFFSLLRSTTRLSRELFVWVDEQLNEQLLKNSDKTYWVPDHVKLLSWILSTSLKSSLVSRFLTEDPHLRLGARGAAEVKQHIFFKDINWGTLARQKAAFVPASESAIDTSYFRSRYS
ncbi:Protein kinase-like domain protein [Raphanus sativus]|nr:Protein kinase-like domain protein [Raphanus sativus]